MPEIVDLNHSQVPYFQTSNRLSSNLAILNEQNVVDLLLQHCLGVQLLEYDLSTIGSTLEHNLNLLLIALVCLVFDFLFESSLHFRGKFYCYLLMHVFIET